MICKLGTLLAFAGLSCALTQTGWAQDAKPAPAGQESRATAYYNFAMGHLYATLAETYGYRSEYVDKAIEHYNAALKADPGATQASEEIIGLYIQSGKFADAVAQAENLLKKDPGNLEAQRMLGRIYVHLIQRQQSNSIDEQRLRQAIEQFSMVTEKDPKDIESWLMLGRLYRLAQNAAESEKAYKRALEVDPENEYALSGLAMVYGDMGDAKSAAEMSRKLAAVNPSPRTLVGLAKAYEDLRDYSQAAEALRKALDMAPRNRDLKKNLAEDVLLSGDLDGALKLYDELAAADPKDANMALRISLIYRQKRDFVKARQALDRALALDPGSLEIRFSEVSLLKAQGKYDEAIAQLRKMLDSTSKRDYSAAERRNRVLLLGELGSLYNISEKHPEAVEAYRQIAALDPDTAANASAQIIETYRQARDFTSAEREAAAAAQKFPNDRTVKMVRASLLADLGRTEEAAAVLKQLLDGQHDRETYLALAQVYDKGRKFPEVAQALDAAEKLSEDKDDREAIYFMRGAMYERMQKTDLAEAEFRRVLEMDPQNSSALNYLGYMLADRNIRLEEAQKLIRKAVDLEPNNGAYLDSLGWVYFRMGRLDDAETYLLHALQRVSRDPTVHDHLGDVYWEKGRVKEAIAQWEISLREWHASSRADADPVEIAKIQKKLETARVRLARESH
jgi:tetratricopeptide (TPR) repeat protein